MRDADGATDSAEIPGDVVRRLGGADLTTCGSVNDPRSLTHTHAKSLLSRHASFPC